MHPLELQTLDLIRRDCLIPSGCTAILGVSGGSDSVALLLVLSRLRELLDCIPVAVYVDHGLRPLEAENEKEYVASLAAKLEVDFESIAIDAGGYAENRKLSLEHAARDLRYGAFRKTAEKRNAAVIVTAHTADDQAEEVLIRLLRGSGRKGISGMQTKYREIVRPFLETNKQDILAYLEENETRFLVDSSNDDIRFLRNRVRHELIPFLEQRFEPGIKKALRKAAQNLAEDEKLLEELTQKACDLVLVRFEPEEGASQVKLRIDRKLFARQPRALKRRIVERLLWQFGSRARYAHIMQVVQAAENGRTGSELHLEKGLRVGVRREFLEFVYPEGKRAWRGRLYPG